MNDLKFDAFRWLHLVWVVAALGGVMAYGAWRRRRDLAAFATANLLPMIGACVSKSQRAIKSGLVLAGLLCLVVAAMGPRWGYEYEEVQQRGIDLMVLLDVSRSMLAEDVTPSRLERAKQDVRDLLGALAGDRVGLVTFAGSATLTCPLTTDYSFFRLALDEVDTRSTSQMGSEIGGAIEKSIGCFDDSIQAYKAILLISDGESHDEKAVEAATKAYKEHGIRVFTIGLGDAKEGARIPIGSGATRRYLVHDGQEVWSKLDSRLLEAVARAGGGAYVPVGTAHVDIDQIYHRYIAAVEEREFGTERVKRYFAKYQWFAAPALVLLTAAGLMSDRRKRRPEPMETMQYAVQT